MKTQNSSVFLTMYFDHILSPTPTPLWSSPSLYPPNFFIFFSLQNKQIKTKIKTKFLLDKSTKSNQTKPKSAQNVIFFVLASYSWAWDMLWSVVNIPSVLPLMKTKNPIQGWVFQSLSFFALCPVVGLYVTFHVLQEETALSFYCYVSLAEQ